MAEKKRKSELFENLKVSLQKEISLMRELLANMHQYELSLQFDDKGSWEQVMVERTQMILRLGTLRDARLVAMEEFEERLSIESCDSIEILSLRDQLFALAERMHSLKERNKHLSEQLRSYPEGRLREPGLQSIREQKPKRKVIVATYPPKEG